MLQDFSRGTVLMIREVNHVMGVACLQKVTFLDIRRSVCMCANSR